MPYNDVNNQQDATTFSFINLFNSALHVYAYTVKKVLLRMGEFVTRNM